MLNIVIYSLTILFPDDPLTNGLNTTVLTNRSKGPAGKFKMIKT